MRKNLSKMFFGIAVVAAGIIFLGSAFGFWEISELSGWWTVFIIVPAIGSMIASGLDLLNVAAFAVGVAAAFACSCFWQAPRPTSRKGISRGRGRSRMAGSVGSGHRSATPIHSCHPRAGGDPVLQAIESKELDTRLKTP